MMDLERQNPGAAHWSRQQYQDLFLTSDNQGSERFAWVVEDESELRSGRVSSASLDILAFLAGRRVDAEWELENIVVSQTVHRQGLGTLLLREFVANARAQNSRSIFLEVRESNLGARLLYQKMNFAETGLRKSYYADPTEDAILYQLNLD